MDMIFPVSGVEVFVLWPFLVALVVSFFTSMGGVSGAFLLLPYQVSVLGFTSPAVSSTNLVFNIVAIPSGLYRFIREGRMLWPLAVTMIVGLVPGVTLGAYIRLRFLPDPNVFKMFVGCVLLYIGGRLVWDIATAFRKKGAAKEPGKETATSGPDLDHMKVKPGKIGLMRISYTYGGETHAFNPLWILVFVVAVGVIGGAYGIGGGALMAPILVTIFRLPVHSIAGATLTSTFATSVIGVIVYTWVAPLFNPGTESTSPDLLLGGLLGLGGLIGHYCGARAQKHVKAQWIKVILAGVILFVSLKYVIQFFV